MNNKLKQLRTRFKLTQVELSKQLNVSQGTLSLWEQGKIDIDSDSLKQLSKIFGVTVDYIICNSTYKKESEEPPQTEFTNIFPIKTKKLPLLGSIACGQPILAEEEYGEFATVSEDIDADFCLLLRQGRNPRKY